MTSILLTGAGSSRSGGSGDPLAGIPYLGRFETHWGDKVLRPWFWQDTARTIPVVGEGDPIATAGPDVVGAPTQEDPDKQFLVLYEPDGTPTADGDGVNDDYESGLTQAQIVTTCLFRNKAATFGNYYGLVEVSSSTGSSAGRLMPVSAGTTQFHNDPPPTSVRKNGVDLTAPFDLTVIDEWMVVTVVSHVGTVHPKGYYQLEGFHCANISVIGHFVYDGIPSTEDRDAVEAFYETLKPNP